MANEMREQEIWKDIKFTDTDGTEYDYTGKYQVSNMGRIKSLVGGNERIMKQNIDRDYYRIILSDSNSNQKRWRVNRLVAHMFVPNDNPAVNTVANHLNEDKLDNRAENLEWTTQQANLNYGTRNERVSRTKTGKSTPRCRAYKGTNQETGETIVFESIKDLEEAGFSISMVYYNCNGRCKSHMGYTWERIF